MICTFIMATLIGSLPTWGVASQGGGVELSPPLLGGGELPLGNHTLEKGEDYTKYLWRHLSVVKIYDSGGGESIPPPQGREEVEKVLLE